MIVTNKSKPVFKKQKSNFSPVEYASALGKEYASSLDIKTKRKLGQFFTPKSISRYMSRFISIKSNKNKISILDPGAGVGILSCAAVEKIAFDFPDIKEIHLTLYELDQSTLPILKQVITQLSNWSKNKGINFFYNIIESDFILERGTVLRNESLEKFEVIISNPPYFKLSKLNERSIAAELIVYGQPNIYFIFLAISSRLLTSDGNLISITPRSFTAGKYFRKFREFFFKEVQLSQIHVFESRNKAFKNDNVLQETIILNCTKRLNNLDSNVELTFSQGTSDIDNSRLFICPESEMIDLKSNNRTLFLPASVEDILLREKFARWKQNLTDLGLKVSTGPVVFFRNTESLSKQKTENDVPLIWLNNIYPMNFTWPIDKSEKAQFIKDKVESKSTLLKNRNYVLMRRFSAKGDKSRIIACPYIASTLQQFEKIGIENKVNYIYKIGSELSDEETIGLSALLSSSYYNRFFVMFNGNTNVSAAELNQIPLPPLETIATIGKIIIKIGATQENIENITKPLFK